MQGHNVGASPGSTHRPTAVAQPAADAWARNASLSVDLPIPGSPSISTSCGRPDRAVSSAATSACHSRSRSTSSVRGAVTRCSGAITTGAGASGAVNNRVVSWARMRLSSSRSSGPGSSPSSSSNIERAVDRARRASACRLLRYNASASNAHSRSLSGCSSTAVCNFDTASVWRPKRKQDVEAILDRGLALAVEPHHDWLNLVFRPDAAQRRATPQRQCLVEELQCIPVPCGTDFVPCRRDQRPEPMHIDLVGGELQQVARCLGDEDLRRGSGDAVRFQRPTQPRDVALQRAQRGTGRLVTPQPVDQSFDGDDTPDIERQVRDDGALLRATQLDRMAVVSHLDRTENVHRQHAGEGTSRQAGPELPYGARGSSVRAAARFGR